MPSKITNIKRKNPGIFEYGIRSKNLRVSKFNNLNNNKFFNSPIKNDNNNIQSKAMKYIDRNIKTEEENNK